MCGKKLLNPQLGYYKEGNQKRLSKKKVGSNSGGLSMLVTFFCQSYHRPRHW